MKKMFLIAGASAAVAMTAASSAEIQGCFYHGYWQTGEEFGGNQVEAYVVDMYMWTDNANDALLNVYNANIANSQGDVAYYQSLTAGGWAPNFQDGIFDTTASRYLDSFVSSGGRDNDGNESVDSNGNLIQMSGNGSGVDPAFGGNDADAPAANAGWYNGNPNNPIGVGYLNSTLPGALGQQLTMFIGRFTLDTEFDLSGELSVTWNEGIGTPGNQETFGIAEIPAPGALALLGLSGLAARRRRG